MKSAPFTLHQPKTVGEAVTLLSEVADDGGLILAGGQSLIPMLALRVAYPPHLIDINRIEGLDRISLENGHLVIGATARHAHFHYSARDDRLGRLLANVSRHIAHYPIRMRGTFCGSLAHADPASEWCLVAATLDAEITAASVHGQRQITAQEYFAGAMVTLREPDEMLVQVSLPLLSNNTNFGFYEFNRRAGDFALGMCLAVYDLSDGLMTNVRIGLGGIEDHARRIPEAEALLEGQAPSEHLHRQAGEMVADGVEPMEDASTPGEYRRDLARVVVCRALKSASLVGA